MRVTIACIAAISLMVLPVQGSILAQSNTSDNIWYFGKGIRQNSYLMYAVDDDSGFSPTGSSPFYFAIYFDTFDSNTNSWTGEVFANQNDKVSTNKFTHFLDRESNGTVFTYNVETSGCINCLTDEEIFLDSAARAYDQIFGPFQWYVKYPGKNLTDSKWDSEDNPLASVTLNGTKMVSVDAGTFNCTELVDEGGNVALINKDLPFPVAGSYIRGASMSSSGELHRYYLNYQLVQIGENIPTVPEFTGAHIIGAVVVVGIAVMIARTKLIRNF